MSLHVATYNPSINPQTLQYAELHPKKGAASRDFLKPLPGCFKAFARNFESSVWAISSYGGQA